MGSEINRAFIGLVRRAERQERETLVDTFVDVGDLFTVLSSRDHQLIYGRRGTGKTHVLTYLAEHLNSPTSPAIQIDLRTIGSSTSIYNDPRLSQAERGSRLLKDVLAEVHDHLTTLALEASDDPDREGVDSALRSLDRLAAEITEVQVVGTVEQEEASNSEDHHRASLTAGIASEGPRVAFDSSESSSRASSTKRRQTGQPVSRVHFGAVRTHIDKTLDGLGVNRVWILLDEWSELPMELQPLLADFIKRALLPVNKLTVKIAVIEQRSSISQAASTPSDRVGFEVGADIAADCNLDQYMVFGYDAEVARTFFRDLAFKHVSAELGAAAPQRASDFVSQTFTQRTALDELVRAAEGVPRDFINVAILAARKADDKKIAVPHVREAAREWYQRDKEAAVSADGRRLLHWIIDEVIGSRRARAFLLRQDDSHHDLVTELYDARVLHVIKRGVSARDTPGVRYDVYQIDYGCYVELVKTSKAPQGLLFAALTDESDGEWVEVPADDYRSIRRAILDLSVFFESL